MLFASFDKSAVSVGYDSLVAVIHHMPPLNFISECFRFFHCMMCFLVCVVLCASIDANLQCAVYDMPMLNS